MGVCPLFRILGSENMFSKPAFPLEDDHGYGRDDQHENGVNPESVRTVAEGDGGRHREHVGIDRHREEDGGKDGQNLHREVELAREEGIIGGFERFDGFFVAFKNVPDADIGADEVLKVWFEIISDVRMIFREERFEYGTLRFQCPSEIEDIALEDGNFEYHFLLFFREDLGFDEIETLGDMVELRETGVEEDVEHGVEEMCRSLAHVEPTAAFVLREFGKEFRERIDVVFVAGNEVSVSEDDIEFARESRPVIGIEKGYVDGKEKTSVVLDDFRLIGRRDEFLDGEGMDGKILLKIGDIFVVRVVEINPGNLMEFHLVHRRYPESLLLFISERTMTRFIPKYTRIILTAEGKYRRVFRYAESFPGRSDRVLSAFRVERARFAWFFYRRADLSFSSELQPVYA